METIAFASTALFMLLTAWALVYYADMKRERDAAVEDSDAWKVRCELAEARMEYALRFLDEASSRLRPMAPMDR